MTKTTQLKVRLGATLLMLVISRGAPGASLSAELLAGWVSMDAPSGHEHLATGPLGERLPEWTHDRAGNLARTVGEGRPLTVVACLLDAPSFTVSQITEDGYLRLHAAGRLPKHPLWTQAHEGQQLRIHTATGPLIGVTALANGHFMNLHRQEKAFTRPEDLWLDVGAESADDVEKMGISLLDPVTRHLPAWFFGKWVAGPSAGARLGCALAAAAAEAGITGAGRTRYVLSTRASFGAIGAISAVLDGEAVDRFVLLERGADPDSAEPPVSSLVSADRLPESLPQTTTLRPAVVDAGALMERFTLREAESLARDLLSALGASEKSLEWIEAPRLISPRNAQPASASGQDADRLAVTLARLGELPGVFGHEGPVRQFVLNALPPWAKPQTDALGNIWLDLGPRNQDATVFMAHMDEVGWEVTDIAADGTVDLKRRGGALGLAREGQPAVLQIDPGTGAESIADPARLRGVFLNRTAPASRWPEADLQAYFGLDAGGLARAGVRVGMPVTGYKEAHRLGPHRFTVRSMDDRVGTAALLHALRAIDPGTLTQRLIFAWSVQEEGGLYGAAALARRFAGETRRIYSVDTFVTSDTPLEAPHFAYAPLGKGPVLRSMESSGMASRAELDRNREIARTSGIPFQIGMTQGGTDGTMFTLYGAPNAGLSWPGRYSHGPAELGDLRDMENLVGLILAFAKASGD